MRNLIKRAIAPLLKKAHSAYVSKPRRYSYKDISVIVEPTVFPPFITMSTKLLLEFVETLPLKGKTFLELGCGCGIISILAAKKDATVMATDINEAALSALEKNAKSNQVGIETLNSDLFTELSDRTFDFIVINPPYYPKNPTTMAENAWFCGADFDYFESLFSQLPRYSTSENNIFMILSQDCELEKIKAIASKNEMAFELVLEKKVAGEKNFIFKIVSL